MTDEFNLKKNPYRNNTNTIKTEGSNSDNPKLKSCSNAPGEQCDHIIADGINVGWVWNRLGKVSSLILNRLNKVTPRGNNKETPEHKYILQLEKLTNMDQTYTVIQTIIKTIIYGIICITIISLCLQPNPSQPIMAGDNDYFSVTQICYFIRQIIENKDDYATTFFILFGVLQFITLGFKAASTYFINCIFLWIIIGNFMLLKENLHIFSMLFISSFISGIIDKSHIYYKDRLLSTITDDTKESEETEINEKIQNSKKNVQALKVCITIVILAIIMYMLFKKYKLNKDSNDIEGYENLSEFFKNKIFSKVTEDQKHIAERINILNTNYASLDVMPRAKYSRVNEVFTNTLTKNLTVTDEWVKNCVEQYNIAGYTSGIAMPEVVGLNENWGNTIANDPNVFNSSWTQDYIIYDILKGITYRCLELGLQVIVAPIIALINWLKLGIKFIFNNPNKNINNVHDLNLLSFFNFELLFPSNITLGWRRVAEMSGLIIKKISKI